MQKQIAAAVLLAYAAPLLVPQQAFADDYENLDSDEKKKKKKKKKSDREETLSEEVVREVERGVYAKAAVGSAFYLLNYGVLGGDTLRSGTSLGIAVGQDFLDHERKSMAWEVGFYQGVHNGMHYEEQAILGVPSTAHIQGDTRTYTISVAYEYSAYVSRRFGIGFRAGGGLMLSPWLVYADSKDEVLSALGEAGLAVHDTPHPLGFVGPTFEYYTKLSHFSIGADADVSYAVGFDLGVTATGYLKYTF